MVLFTRDPEMRTFIQSEEALVVDGFTETVHWASKTPGRSFDLETSLNSVHGLTHCYLSHSTETKSRRDVGEQRRPVQLLSFFGTVSPCTPLRLECFAIVYLPATKSCQGTISFGLVSAMSWMLLMWWMDGVEEGGE